MVQALPSSQPRSLQQASVYQLLEEDSLLADKHRSQVSPRHRASGGRSMFLWTVTRARQRQRQLTTRHQKDMRLQGNYRLCLLLVPTLGFTVL